MKNFKIYISSLLVMAAIVSCSSENSTTGEVVDDNNNSDPTTSNKVTYNGTIKSIIDSKCISCHGVPQTNGAPMSLLTYDDVKNAVNNRGLIDEVDSGAMPPNGTDLTSAQVQAIKDWKSGGYLN